MIFAERELHFGMRDSSTTPAPADQQKNHRWGRVAVRITNQKLTAAELRIYIALCGHADKNGFCCVGFETLAEECGISKRQVIRAIAQLVEIGELRVEKRRKKERGRWVQGANQYEIPAISECHPCHPEKPANQPFSECQNRRFQSDVLGKTFSKKRQKSSTFRVTPLSPITESSLCEDNREREGGAPLGAAPPPRVSINRTKVRPPPGFCDASGHDCNGAYRPMLPVWRPN